MSPAEAAEWLGISRRQIYRLMDAGDLHYRQCGARRLIARTTLEQFVADAPRDRSSLEALVADMQANLDALRRALDQIPPEVS